MNHRKLTAGVLVGAVALLAGVGSGMVQAAPRVDPTTTLPVVMDTTTVLPIMGAPLTIHVQTGPGGNISLAEITPADPTMTATADPRRVTFTNADGTVKVSVKSRGNTQSISARAGSLADITGDGSWAGDVFGTGTVSNVKYHIGESATTPGAPDITGVSTDDPNGTVNPTKSSTDDEGGMCARASVTFVLDGQSRTLTIKACVFTFTPEAENDDDDNNATTTSAAVPPAPVTVAKLSITLSGFKGVAQDLATAAGPKVWTGFLCDGTKATINYTVNPDGTLTLDSVDPATAQTKNNDGKIEVRFTDKARVKIRGRVNGTQITINIQDKIRCKGAADPTVNGATVVTNTGDGHGGGDHGGGGGDD